MTFLSNKEFTRTDSYRYWVDLLKVTGSLFIVFVDGRFDHCDFPFSGIYTRDQWKILKNIEEEITRLEETYTIGEENHRV